MKHSPVANDTSAAHNNDLKRYSLQLNVLHTEKFDITISPVFPPPEYRYFDNDPIELFTRIGLRASANFRYNKNPWKDSASQTDHLFSVNYGFLRKTFVLGYVGTFRQLVGNWNGLLKARYDIVAIENFYGIGNNTINDKEAPRTFYVSSSERIYASAGLARDFYRIHHVEASLFYQHIKVNSNGDHFVNKLQVDQPGIGESVFSAKQFAGIEAGYRFNNTNSDIYPTKGMRFILGSGYVRNINDNTRSFVKGVSSLSFYYPLTNAFSLALRAGGGTIVGNADYYHLNTLGGNENLRGYPRERFFGKSSFYNNNEIRWITPANKSWSLGKVGLLAFYDQGRVWQSGERSTLWHTGYGGGLILIPLNKITLTGTYGISKEGRQILLQSYIFF